MFSTINVLPTIIKTMYQNYCFLCFRNWIRFVLFFQITSNNVLTYIPTELPKYLIFISCHAYCYFNMHFVYSIVFLYITCFKLLVQKYYYFWFLQIYLLFNTIFFMNNYTYISGYIIICKYVLTPICCEPIPVN